MRIYLLQTPSRSVLRCEKLITLSIWDSISLDARCNLSTWELCTLGEMMLFKAFDFRTKSTPIKKNFTFRTDIVFATHNRHFHKFHQLPNEFRKLMNRDNLLGFFCQPSRKEKLFVSPQQPSNALKEGKSSRAVGEEKGKTNGGFV